MTILIVESDQALASVWAQHLARQDLEVVVAQSSDEACEIVTERRVEVVVLDLDLPDGGALGVADMAAYRNEHTRIIFVTATTFFSDGSIFTLSPNAAGYMTSDAKPEDLAALVEHHSRTVNPA